jgi:hypothetical protein
VLPHTGATPTARVLATHAMSDCAQSTLDGEYGDIYIGFMLLLWSGDRRRTPGPAAGDPEALIEEARRRARLRRRRVAALATLALVAAAASAYGVSSGGAGVVAQTATTPFASLRAFAGRGELAFVSRGAAWALDAERGTLRRLPKPPGWTASNPVLSHDGRWLAYITAASTVVTPTTVELWLAHGDGSGARVVRGLDVDGLVGWSPTADVLAVIGGSTSSTVELIRPGGSTRTVVSLSGGPMRQGSVQGAVWSPDGHEIAVSTYAFSASLDGTVIRAYTVAGGPPTTWFRIPNNRPFPVHICSKCGGARQTIADLVGWWPRWGIGFWVYCCGATRNLDSTPLAFVAHPGARPRVLVQTLARSSTVAPATDGALAVVASGAAGRVLGQDKTVEHCDAATLTCTPVPEATTWIGPDHQRCPTHLAPEEFCVVAAGIRPAGQPGSGVSLDPEWSPDASMLAYVRAPIWKCLACSEAVWQAAHAIYVWNARTGATRRVGPIDGANTPTWSADGRDLLFVRDDGIWLQPISGGRPVEIEHPLFAANALTGPDGVDYFGQIPWSAQFSWWSS